MRKPLIGVLPLYDSEKDSYWMLPGYMKGVEEAGGIPVIFAADDRSGNDPDLGGDV
ncbi:gamma-glutamyl-gamma-aminobutyrate hydrolase family protein [Paenibacillus sp. P25]|nr:gamma-glutamyl-gamma-aminobutyrate hydrolase family protein [Paenibacillus sp. P25]